MFTLNSYQPYIFCEMQTIRFNKSVLALIGAFFIFLLCIFSYLSSDLLMQRDPLIIRDIQSRLSDKINKAQFSNVQPIDEIKNESLNQIIKPENNEKKRERDAEKNGQNLEELIGKIHYENSENDENDRRRLKVKEMMIHAWSGYRNYSWGANELKPQMKKPNSQNIFGGSQMPATIIDAADTLFLMDLMDEYKEARDYIEKNFSMSKSTSTLSVFETTIRILGGFLSLYALTKDQMFLDKAKEVGEALLPAFQTPSGIPKSNLNVATRSASNYGWANSQSILAEVGTLHIEFVYLARTTGHGIFEKKVRKVRDALEKAEKIDGLYNNYINPDTGRFSTNHHISLGALGDSFYEYLIKSWILSNKKDQQAKKMYWETSEQIQKQMIAISKKSKLTYTVELRDGTVDHKMGHLACFVPGMFALQAVNEKSESEKAKIMNLAEELGKTCHESYIRSDSGIGPEMFYFNDFEEATSRRGENGYIQRPEVIEGFFYLWRLTGKQKYRDWVWEAIESIDKYCRVEAGFTGLQNVYKPEAGRDDVQQSFFLAETLKYAYLTFADNSLISLDKWVFNTEAHPVPILDY